MEALDITKLSVTELKAYVYDLLILQAQNQANIKLLEDEINRRKEKPSPVEAKASDNKKD